MTTDDKTTMDNMSTTLDQCIQESEEKDALIDRLKETLRRVRKLMEDGQSSEYILMRVKWDV